MSHTADLREICWLLGNQTNGENGLGNFYFPDDQVQQKLRLLRSLTIKLIIKARINCISYAAKWIHFLKVCFSLLDARGEEPFMTCNLSVIYLWVRSSFMSRRTQSVTAGSLLTSRAISEWQVKPCHLAQVGVITLMRCFRDNSKASGYLPCP